MAWIGTITEDGEDLLEQAVLGATLNLIEVQTGKGTAENMKIATSVTNPADSGSMTFELEPDGIRIRIKVPASSGEAYTMKQIGIFGRIGSGTEKLFALLQDTEGVLVPAGAEFPDFFYNMNTFIEVSSASTINVTVDTTALVSQGQLNSALANVVNLARTFYSSTKKVSITLANTTNKALLATMAYGNGDDAISHAQYGAVVLIVNGKYINLYKGTGISTSVSSGVLDISSPEYVKGSIVEL